MTSDRSPPKTREDMLQQVSIEQLVDMVQDCGVISVNSHELAKELLKRGFVMNEELGKSGGTLVLHKAQHSPEDNDLERMQSLVVDAYAPYSPKSFKAHPFVEDLVRSARICAPQQIIMQSPSEQEFMRTVQDLITHEKCEQEVYADVRYRAAYTRLVGSPRLELHLMVEEVQFGVTQSFDNLYTRGHFVYCIEIKISPSEKWAHHCTQKSAKPGDTYNLQRHSTLGVTERLSKMSLPELREETDTTLENATGEDVVKHRWLPAAFDPKSSDKSVEWTWKMVSWKDGQTFNEDNPTLFSYDTIPELPYKNPEVVRFRDLDDVNEATWEVSTDVAKALNGRLDWNFEIKIYTVCLQQVQFRVGKDVVTYRKKAQRVAAKFKGKTSRSNALIIPPP